MLNKIKKIKLSKSKYIYTVIAGLIIIAIGFTFAWWRWSSDINAIVNGQVCAPEIVFVGGSTINGHDLLPVRTKEEGLTKDIQVNLENLCDNDTAVLNLNLKPDIFPEGLSDPSFKWALYEVTTEEVQGVPTETLTYVNDGNFNGKRQYVNDNDLISIATDLIVTQNISTYRLFIWIDGTMDNASTMGDNFFKFSIYGTGKDAIYREYVINNNIITGTSTSYFLVDALPRTSIESIDIVSFSNLPEGVIYVEDVSSNSDESIKLYYLENPETNLKKVYLASSSGLIKMNTSMDYMFAGLTHVESLDLSRLDTSNVTSMIGVFYNSPSLTSINMNNWDTSKVTTMNQMFRGASGLTSLDLSNFNTSKVTNMTSMFMSCTSLVDLNVSSFDISNVTVIYSHYRNGMFRNCTSLKNLDLSSFKTNKITNMMSMFEGCSNLEYLDISNLDTSKVTTMSMMFSGCSKLKSLDLSSFNTALVTDMSSMFSGCSMLESINLSSFRTPKLTTMDNMFSGCTKLNNLNLTNFDTSKVTNMRSMFKSCSSLITLDLSNFVTTSLTNMSGMFQGCRSLTTLDLSNFNTSNVTSMSEVNLGLFDGCTKLESINLKGNFNTSRVSNFAQMFRNCSSLISLDLSNFDTSKVTNMSSMFTGCSKLESVNLSSFNTSNVTTMSGMFESCSNLNTVDLSSFRTPKLTTMASMFRSSGIETIDLSTFDTSNVTIMQYMFENCFKIKKVDLSNFDTSNVTNMFRMFINSGVKEVNLSSFTSDSSPNIDTMFHCCYSLTKLDMSDFDFSKITSYSSFLGYVSSTAEIIVKDCEQYSLFRTKFGTSYSNLHTVNNDNCST